MHIMQIKILPRYLFTWPLYLFGHTRHGLSKTSWVYCWFLWEVFCTDRLKTNQGFLPRKCRPLRVRSLLVLKTLIPKKIKQSNFWAFLLQLLHDMSLRWMNQIKRTVGLFSISGAKRSLWLRSHVHRQPVMASKVTSASLLVESFVVSRKTGYVISFGYLFPPCPCWRVREGGQKNFDHVF